MSDVARAAGVSVSTVSHVLNGTRPVNAATRERVERAMAASGYRRNAVARSLVRRSTSTVGIAISALTNPYFGPLVSAMNDDLSRAGYHVVIADTGDEAGRESVVVDQLLDRRVDGLVLAPAPGSAVVAEILREGVPLVLVDRGHEAPCDQVRPENAGPVRVLTHHLADLGHRRVAVMAGMDGLDTTVERLRGFTEAAAERGLDEDPSLVLHGRSESAGARAAALELFSTAERPSAIAVLNNAMTIGVMRALNELRLRVPEDVALVAYDDFEWADLFSPRLTAVRQDLPAMARSAVGLLLARIEDPRREPVRESVRPEIMHRQSCGCTPQHTAVLRTF